MEDELQLLAADRDFAARTADKLTVELDALRAAHEELKLRYDRACRSPIEADGLSERMLRMVELAHVEANEIVQNARTKAERTRTAADEEARRLRGRYERKLHELEQRRAAMEAEHAELMRTSRAEFEEKERQAEERRRRLDEESARRRQQAERDLALVLKARREEATKAIEQREAESKERAATLVAEAESRAADMIAQATERVRELEEVQRQLTGRLREARDVLAAAMPLTAPLPEETAEPALAHARPGSGEDEPVADDVRADSAREVRPGVPPAGVRSARAGVVEVPEQRTDEVEPAEVPSVGAGSSDEALSGEAVSAGSASEAASEEAEVSGPVSTRREDRDRKPSVDSPVRPVVAAPGVRRSRSRQ
ncbi:metallopeptidase [Prauserella oleivorans]|uniref:Metallopeptidase n=1 Tax=Prauserella oleivorans TaxID=1478153 RepID=A0ABW5WAX0_9PSEU